MRNIINLHPRDVLSQLAWIERLRALVHTSDGQQREKFGGTSPGREKDSNFLNTHCPVCQTSFYESCLGSVSLDLEEEEAESKRMKGVERKGVMRTAGSGGSADYNSSLTRSGQNRNRRYGMKICTPIE